MPSKNGRAERAAHHQLAGRDCPSIHMVMSQSEPVLLVRAKQQRATCIVLQPRIVSWQQQRDGGGGKTLNRIPFLLEKFSEFESLAWDFNSISFNTIMAKLAGGHSHKHSRPVSGPGPPPGAAAGQISQRPTIRIIIEECSVGERGGAGDGR